MARACAGALQRAPSARQTVTLRTALPLLDLAVAGGERAWRVVQWIGGRFQAGGKSCRASGSERKPQVMSNDDERGETGVQVSVQGIRIPTGLFLTPEIQRHMQRGSYELAECRALWHELRAGDRVLELGTGCGFLAAFAALRGAAVLTVEADPQLEPKIRQVFALNGVAPELLIRAVSRYGLARRVLRAPDFWATRTEPLDGSESPGETLVDGVTLPALLLRHWPTVVVIDIEGGELGLCGVPLPPCVRVVIVETHGAECAGAVADWLRAEGFELSLEQVSTSPDVTTWRRLLGQ